MTVVSRATIRQALASQLAATGVMPTAKGNIYGYMRSGFAGLSPVVRVLSGGSVRPRTPQHGTPSRFLYTVQLWVLYFDDGNAAQQAAAEDTLDALEAELTAWLGNESVRNQVGLWRDLAWYDASRVDVRQIGTKAGSIYIVEDVPIEVTVDG